MSCWVVPAIAAELWGVSLAQVLAGVADGTVPSQREHGFLFVDVSGHGRPHHTTRKPHGPPPPTFVPVTRNADEEAAPDGAVAAGAEPVSYHEPTACWPHDEYPFIKDPVVGDCLYDATVPAGILPPDDVLDAPELADSVTIEEDAEVPPLCEEEDDKPIAHWRQRRQSVSRTRRPPPLAA